MSETMLNAQSVPHFFHDHGSSISRSSISRSSISRSSTSRSSISRSSISRSSISVSSFSLRGSSWIVRDRMRKLQWSQPGGLGAQRIRRHKSLRTKLRVVLAGERNGRCSGKEWVLAIDVGTGGTKAALISSVGRVSASAFAPHKAPSSDTAAGIPGCQEQDPENWWWATKQAVCSCLGGSEATAKGISIHQVRCVAVTGQMQDVILVPQPGLLTKPKAILYSDARAGLEANEIASLAGGSDRIISNTGLSQGASGVLAKLRWLDKFERDAVQLSQSLLLGGHDYIVWKLCEAFVVDATTASTTGLTTRNFQYAKDLMEDVELGHWISKLPPIHPPDYPCGKVSPTAASELGFAGLKGLPVLHACGDAGAVSLGAGAGALGSMYAYLGTSGWIAGSFQRPTTTDANFAPDPPGVFTLAHAEPSLVFKAGSILNAGGNLQWAASNVGPSTWKESVDWEEFNRLAVSVPPGSKGLLYLPYLNGERCPFEDPNARACFLGISAATTRADLLRAVMEGVTFAMRSAKDAMLESVQKFPEGPLRLVGGGARSPLWPAILAGVFGQTVEVLEGSQEVGVKGAALLAGKWLGWKSTESLDGEYFKDTLVSARGDEIDGSGEPIIRSPRKSDTKRQRELDSCQSLVHSGVCRSRALSRYLWDIL